MSRPRLTPAVEQAVVAYVRAGGFPDVAAEAAGVPAEVFRAWLRLGDGPGARRPYRGFADAVRQAAAQARLGAEVSVRNDKPLDWLRCGPGRESAERPGWTTAVRPRPAAASSDLFTAEVQALFASVLTVLEPFPDIRAAVAAALPAR